MQQSRVDGTHFTAQMDSNPSNTVEAAKDILKGNVSLTV